MFLGSSAISPVQKMDADAQYRALLARDRRFDGVFFVGVSTTGIYCRPICPARTPGRARCTFYRSASEAEGAGFRACLRCRPELAPGHASVDARSRLTTAALARLDAGALNEGSVDDLAGALGVSARHLRRTMEAEIGVVPLAYAASKRLALAKRLIHDTAMPMTEVAFSSGFSSLRRFNAAFVAQFARPPSSMRRATGARAGADAMITLRLDYRPPLDWEALLRFIAARAILGVERVDLGASGRTIGTGAYYRTVHIGDARGYLVARHLPARSAVVVEVSPSLAGVLMPLVARLRALFDLDAEPSAVAARLAKDPLLAPMVRARPGLRVPGAFDAFETAVRAVLGQQISVKGATTLAGAIARDRGTSIDTPYEGLDRLFPAAKALLAPPITGVPAARARTIQILAGAPPIVRGDDPAETEARLLAMPGVGPWTAGYLMMRTLGWPDAFPAADLGIKKALGETSPKRIEARAEAWRPWRAYAAMHLWTGG